jgi:hypothetical protein
MVLYARTTPNQHSTVLLQQHSRAQGKECQLLRRGGQTKQLEMPVTMLPNVKNEQLLFVTLGFKPCKRCSDCRKLLIERSDLVASGALFLKAVHEIKQSISDVSTIIFNSILLYNFSRKSRAPKGVCRTLRKPLPKYVVKNTN